MTIRPPLPSEIQQTRNISVGLLVLALASGCASSSDGTSGHRVVLGVRIKPDAQALAKPNQKGWVISLTQARVGIGPLYYFDGAAFVASLERPERLRTLANAFALLVPPLTPKSAWAHPGHYVPGEARGEFLNAAAIHLQENERVIGSGDGTSGMIRSATFGFSSETQDAELGTHVIVLEGKAAKSGLPSKWFHFDVDSGDILGSNGKPWVEGCVFDEKDVETDGQVVVTIRYGNWLEDVDFEELPDSPESAPTVVPKATIAFKSLTRNVKGASHYSFHFEGKN